MACACSALVEATAFRFSACSAAAALVLCALPAPVAGEPCEPWPGELSPLPAIGSPDPFEAQWALLRATELAGLARALEAEDPLEANRLWARVTCFHPADAEARAGLARTRPEVVHRPVISVERAAPRPGASGRIDEALRPLGVAVRVDPAADLRRVDASLRGAQELISNARYAEALERLDRARPALRSLRAAPGARARRARLATLSATALVAVGELETARERFREALEADPRLELDERDVSPKVLRILDQARWASNAGTP